CPDYLDGLPEGENRANLPLVRGRRERSERGGRSHIILNCRPMHHQTYIQRTIELAEKGRGLTSPAAMVGAVIVKDGRIVGEGFYTYDGVRHAETIALEQAGEAARGATIYTSLEPCSHQGRTPPCAKALINAGVAKVVTCMTDPNPLVNG